MREYRKDRNVGKMRRGRRLSAVLAIAVCICAVSAATSVIPALFAAGEEKDADTCYINSFSELPADIREQRIAGTDQEPVLPDTLEAVVARRMEEQITQDRAQGTEIASEDSGELGGGKERARNYSRFACGDGLDSGVLEGQPGI